MTMVTFDYRSSNPRPLDEPQADRSEHACGSDQSVADITSFLVAVAAFLIAPLLA
jgi:hypothetical protein